MQTVPQDQPLEGPVEAVEIGGEDVVRERRPLRECLGQQEPPARGLVRIGREQQGGGRFGRGPGTAQPVASVGRRTRDPRRLDDPEHTRGARRAHAG